MNKKVKRQIKKLDLYSQIIVGLLQKMQKIVNKIENNIGKSFNEDLNNIIKNVEDWNKYNIDYFNENK